MSACQKPELEAPKLPLPPMLEGTPLCFDPLFSGAAWGYTIPNVERVKGGIVIMAHGQTVPMRFVVYDTTFTRAEAVSFVRGQQRGSDDGAENCATVRSAEVLRPGSILRFEPAAACKWSNELDQYPSEVVEVSAQFLKRKLGDIPGIEPDDDDDTRRTKVRLWWEGFLEENKGKAKQFITFAGA